MYKWIILPKNWEKKTNVLKISYKMCSCKKHDTMQWKERILFCLLKKPHQFYDNKFLRINKMKLIVFK